LLVQLMARAFSLALDNAGKSMAAKMAIIAITTRSSIKVNLTKRITVSVFVEINQKIYGSYKYIPFL